MTLTMDWVWLIVCLGMLVLEVITVGNLVSLWFSFAGLAALGTTFLTDNVAVQLAVFAIVSVAALIMIRPMTKNLLRGNVVSTNADRLIGRQFILNEEINQDSWGKIKVHGEEWSATTADQSSISAHTRVEVIVIEGVKLIVKSVEEA
ncbi:NfeD family protein [Erysipelothrix piscisicarius]|uniref:NfeD family protein n=1 Tax=Erysipelothrix piscisicarius TaxID=2485784 RepID=A0A3Q8S712_9FIRM|nr:NfeD family protein [Erysipelothrix piscisicarius]AZK43789.1 NfeD family protein [Erysipelothrix piscisicarius]